MAPWKLNIKKLIGDSRFLHSAVCLGFGHLSSLRVCYKHYFTAVGLTDSLLPSLDKKLITADKMARSLKATRGLVSVFQYCSSYTWQDTNPPSLKWTGPLFTIKQQETHAHTQTANRLRRDRLALCDCARSLRAHLWLHNGTCQSLCTVLDTTELLIMKDEETEM